MVLGGEVQFGSTAARLLKLCFSVTMILLLVPMPITKRGGVLLALLRYTSVH
jgi:hypothetical protein